MNKRILTAGDIYFSLWKHKFIIISLSMVGLVVGGLLMLINGQRASSNPQYMISSSLAIVSQNQNGQFTTDSENPNSADVYLAENMAGSVAYVAKSERVLKEVIANLNLTNVSVQSLRGALSVAQYNDTQMIELTLLWRSSEQGMEILTELIRILPDILIETLQIGSVNILDEPVEGYRLESQFGRFNAFLYGAVGMLIGLIISILAEVLHPTLRTNHDISLLLGLDILGEIPREGNCKKFKNGGLMKEEGKSTSTAYQEGFATMAYIIDNSLEENKNKCVYITSALEGEGKTTVTANLAIQLSILGRKVLVIDCDLRKPSLGSMFLEEPDRIHSLNAACKEERPIRDTVLHVTDHLDLLLTYLEKDMIRMDEKVIEVIKELKEEYDYILLDSAPSGIVSDTMRLNQIADQAIFVVRQDKTLYEVVKDSLEKLKKSGTSIMGCVINDINVRIPGSKYYFRRYDKSYKYYKKQPTEEQEGKS